MSQNPWQPRQDPLEQALEALVKKIKAGGYFFNKILFLPFGE